MNVIIIHQLFQWLQYDFLGYLRSWEMSVASRTDLTQSERNKMLLSRETIDGFKLTGVVTQWAELMEAYNT